MYEAAAPTPATQSRARRWVGLAASALIVISLLVDGTMKVLMLQPVLDSMPPLGYAVSLARPIGIVLLVCLALYAIPRTSILGAILLTGYLGGAVATNVRVAAPLFTHVLFPVYTGVLVWGALYLRDVRLRALIPFRAAGSA